MKKIEGFKDQHAIILPKFIQHELNASPLTKLLYITDIGYYPIARHHYRQRIQGCQQKILIYCIDGLGWIEIQGNTRKVNKGQYFVIPSGVPHRYWADDKNPWTIYWVHFTGMFSNKFSDPAIPIQTIRLIDSAKNKERIQLFNEIYNTLSMGYSIDNLEYVTICLFHFLGSFSYVAQFHRMADIQRKDIVEKSILFMQEHLTETLSLNEIATHAGYSASHFSTVFKNKTNRSPIDYFLGLKMQLACQMLDFTNMHIKEISYKLAFKDQFYFSRIFKKIIGTTPTEYKRTKKG